MIRRKAGAGATSTKSCSIYRTGRRRVWVPFPDITEAQQAMIAKIYDLLVQAEAAARTNGRVIIEPFDLPITKGLQESIHEFEKIDEQIELQPILDQLTAPPPLDLAYGEDTESRLSEVVGGLSVALARAFKIIDGNLKNPATEHWQKCFRIFHLLLKH